MCKKGSDGPCCVVCRTDRRSLFTSAVVTPTAAFFKSLECHREGACAFVRLSYLQPCALSLLPDDVVVVVVDALTKMNSEK